MMAKIAERTEPLGALPRAGRSACGRDRRDPAYTIAYSPPAAPPTSRGHRPRRPHAVGPLGALISAHRPTCPIWRSARPRDRAALRADVGRAGGLDAARQEVTEDLVKASAARVLELGVVQARRCASASPRACPRAGRAPPACSRSPTSRRGGSARRCRRAPSAARRERVHAFAQLAGFCSAHPSSERELGDHRLGRGRSLWWCSGEGAWPTITSVPPLATTWPRREDPLRGSSTSECRKLAATRSKMPAGCETAKVVALPGTSTRRLGGVACGDLQCVRRCRRRSPSSPARRADRVAAMTAAELERGTGASS